MGIEAKHSYRFGYLKSEQWQNVRLEALAREKALCQICGEESISNDAHHIWYPENIYETTEAHLVILCRPCHDFIHAMIPECKTNSEEEGRSHWYRFSNAIRVWRDKKVQFFQTGIDGGPKQLRDAYSELRRKQAEQAETRVLEVSPDDIIWMIRKWSEAYSKTLPVDKFPPGP